MSAGAVCSMDPGRAACEPSCPGSVHSTRLPRRTLTMPLRCRRRLDVCPADRSAWRCAVRSRIITCQNSHSASVYGSSSSCLARRCTPCDELPRRFHPVCTESTRSAGNCCLNCGKVSATECWKVSTVAECLAIRTSVTAFHSGSSQVSWENADAVAVLVCRGYANDKAHAHQQHGQREPTGCSDHRSFPDGGSST